MSHDRLRPRHFHSRHSPVLLLVTVCLLLAGSVHAQNGTRFRDPGGRYTASLPAGWTATQLNADAVQFAFESAFVTLMVLPGNDPGAAIAAMSKQTGSQWKNWTEARRGDTHYGGLVGPYVTWSGTNPRGVDSYLQMIGVSDGRVVYLLMKSSPRGDFTRLRAAFDQIEQSMALTAGATAVHEAQPPAGAPRPPAPLGPGGPVAPQPTSAPTAAVGTHRMRLVRIVDQRGFERPMTAMTLLLPADWTFDGAAEYDTRPGCPSMLVRLAFRASSPDGRLGVELLPGRVWQWVDDQWLLQAMQQNNQQIASLGGHGCEIGRPQGAEAFLRQVVVPESRRGARVVGAEGLPDALQQLQEEAAVVQRVAAQQGVNVAVRADAGRVRLVYQRQGVATEEWLAAMVSASGVVAPALNMMTNQIGQTMYYTVGADHIFGAHAPQGQLDANDRLFRLIMASVKVDPDWQWRVMEVVAKMTADNSRAAMDRSKIITNTGHEIARIIHETYKNSTKSREHSMESWSQYIRGTATYKNPRTGETMEISNEYGHAWLGADGSYIFSDQAGYNPNSAGGGGSWTELEPVRR